MSSRKEGASALFKYNNLLPIEYGKIMVVVLMADEAKVGLQCNC